MTLRSTRQRLFLAPNNRPSPARTLDTSPPSSEGVPHEGFHSRLHLRTQADPGEAPSPRQRTRCYSCFLSGESPEGYLSALCVSDPHKNRDKCTERTLGHELVDYIVYTFAPLAGAPLHTMSGDKTQRLSFSSWKRRQEGKGGKSSECGRGALFTVQLWILLFSRQNKIRCKIAQLGCLNIERDRQRKASAPSCAPFFCSPVYTQGREG